MLRPIQSLSLALVQARLLAHGIKEEDGVCPSTLSPGSSPPLLPLTAASGRTGRKRGKKKQHKIIMITIKGSKSFHLAGAVDVLSLSSCQLAVLFSITAGLQTLAHSQSQFRS